MTRQDDNIRKRIKSTEKFVPFIRLQQVTGWDGRRYRRFAIVRVLPGVASRHRLVLTIRPAERLGVRYAGVRMDALA